MPEPRPVRLAGLPLGVMTGGVLGACLWAGLATGGPGSDAIGQPPLAVLLVAIAISGLAGFLAIGLFWRRARRMPGIASSAEELLQEVAHAGAEFVWEADTAGRLTSLSDGFERCVGLPLDEALGRAGSRFWATASPMPPSVPWPWPSPESGRSAMSRRAWSTSTATAGRCA
ncbi:MAG: hypothetical protein R3D25_10795 [Geminicoccaceae bacterium]